MCQGTTLLYLWMRSVLDPTFYLYLPLYADNIDDLLKTSFINQVSRHFELINYSEWGSCVNGVLYTCDVLRAGAAGAEPEPGQAGQGAQPDLQDSELRADALRHIVRHRLTEPLR